MPDTYHTYIVSEAGEGGLEGPGLTLQQALDSTPNPGYGERVTIRRDRDRVELYYATEGLGWQKILFPRKASIPLPPKPGQMDPRPNLPSPPPKPTPKPILWIDPRAGSGELLPQFDKTKIDARLKQMTFGDFAFTGNGPRGPVSIGIERKTLGDLMQSCDGENRLFNRQLPGMMEEYDIPILLVEGVFHPVSYDPFSIRVLCEGGGFRNNPQIPYNRIMGIFTSLISMGVQTIQSTGPYHTAKIITQHALWYSRPWASHSITKPNLTKVDIRAPRAHIFSPQRGGAPFTARVLVQIDGVGPDKALALAAAFPTMGELLAASRGSFETVGGIGPKLAEKIYNQLHMGR